MRKIYYLIALAFLTLGLIVFSTTADAGGPWDNQYCDVEVTKIKVVNEQGEVIENLTEEKMVQVISCLTWASLLAVRCTRGTCRSEK